MAGGGATGTIAQVDQPADSSEKLPTGTAPARGTPAANAAANDGNGDGGAARARRTARTARRGGVRLAPISFGTTAVHGRLASAPLCTLPLRTPRSPVPTRTETATNTAHPTPHTPILTPPDGRRAGPGVGDHRPHPGGVVGPGGAVVEARLDAPLLARVPQHVGPQPLDLRRRRDRPDAGGAQVRDQVGAVPVGRAQQRPAHGHEDLPRDVVVRCDAVAVGPVDVVRAAHGRQHRVARPPLVDAFAAREGARPARQLARPARGCAVRRVDEERPARVGRERRHVVYGDLRGGRGSARTNGSPGIIGDRQWTGPTTAM